MFQKYRHITYAKNKPPAGMMGRSEGKEKEQQQRRVYRSTEA